MGRWVMFEKSTANRVFIFVSAVIGAGFATGRELNVYFFSHGIRCGTAGMLISALLFALTAYKTLRIGADFDIKSYKDMLRLIFGKRAAGLFLLASTAFFAVLTAAMAAAFGGLCGGFGINERAASLVFCLVCGICAKRGAGRASFVLCPVMLAGCLYIGLAFYGQTEPCGGDIGFLPDALIYTAYNVLTGTAVLFCCPKCGKRQAVGTAAGIFVLIFVCGWVFGRCTAGTNAPLPIYALVRDKAVPMVLYTLVLTCALFTTALDNVLCLKPYIGVTAACVIGAVLSMIGLDAIVSVLYRVFGVVGCGVVAGVLTYPAGPP